MIYFLLSIPIGLLLFLGWFAFITRNDSDKARDPERKRFYDNLYSELNEL